jgi:hypothetical protein
MSRSLASRSSASTSARPARRAIRAASYGSAGAFHSVAPRGRQRPVLVQRAWIVLPCTRSMCWPARSGWPHKTHSRVRATRVRMTPSTSPISADVGAARLASVRGGGAVGGTRRSVRSRGSFALGAGVCGMAAPRVSDATCCRERHSQDAHRVTGDARYDARRSHAPRYEARLSHIVSTSCVTAINRRVVASAGVGSRACGPRMATQHAFEEAAISALDAPSRRSVGSRPLLASGRVVGARVATDAGMLCVRRLVVGDRRSQRR